MSVNACRSLCFGVDYGAESAMYHSIVIDRNYTVS